MIEPAHGDAQSPSGAVGGDGPASEIEFACASMERRGADIDLSLARCRGNVVLERAELAIPSKPTASRHRAIEPPAWLDGSLTVVSDPSTGAVIHDHLGARPRTILEIEELARLLVVGAPPPGARAQAQALGLRFDPPGPSEIELIRLVFVRLLDLLMENDLTTIQQASQVSAGLEWPLRPLLLEAERALLRTSPPGQGGPRPFAALLNPPPSPLSPSGRHRAISLKDARNALSLGGTIAQGFDQFESRPSQLAMLEAVVETLNEGGHALIEAGTGTGKSFAYLVPAIMFAAANGRRVVVSTNTINLQDQLYEKDLPRVASALEAPVRAAVVKGRTNYLCLRRWTQLLHSETLTAGERSLLVKALFWLPRTQTGDRAELQLSSDEEQAWGRVCALAEACTPLRCQYHRAGLCFLARARKQAEASHIVVINHALLLTDLLTESRVLPDYDHVVVDEAHHLEDEATAQLGWSVGGREMSRHLADLVDSTTGPGRLREAFEVLRRAGGGVPISYGEGEQTVRRCREATEAFASALNAFLTNHGQAGDSGQVDLRITGASRAQPAWSPVEIAWDGLTRSLYGLAQHLARLVGALEIHASAREEANELAAALATEGVFWDTVRQQLQRSIGESASDTIVWLSRSRGDEVVIHLAPLEVSDMLARQLFDAKECVILTSATLTAAGRFDYVRTRLGLEDVRELRVASPFDYGSAALVQVPADMPEPTHPAYQRGVEWVVSEVVQALGGRTLVLFTSYSQLRATAQAVRDDFARLGIMLLAQGVDGGSRAQLLDLFRQCQPAALFGTSSFWEGVDVVGEALSCVIMPRLPFSVPTDPVFQARSECFESPFTAYAVPQAILRFRQGFGRLIRSQHDRGAFIVLDRRVLSKSYGSMFLKSLPDAPLDTGPIRDLPGRVVAWLSSATPPD